ncbi:hypothetical protein KUCAC02_017569, partial [Chaenocephalus aceratus]
CLLSPNNSISCSDHSGNLLVPTSPSTHSLPLGPEPIWPATMSLRDLWPGLVVQPTPPRSLVITNKLEVTPATRK